MNATNRVIRKVIDANHHNRRPRMHEIIRPTVELSLIFTPPADRTRDRASLDERIARLDRALEAVRDLALFWPSSRSGELFEDFEAQLRELLRATGRGASELMLAAAEGRDRRERPSRFSIGETVYRVSAPEPRSLNTWAVWSVGFIITAPVGSDTAAGRCSHPTRFPTPPWPPRTARPLRPGAR